MDMCLETARKTSERGLVYTVFSTLQVRRLLWAKKWMREETYREEERTGASEAMRAMVSGRLSFEKGRTPPSRFVRQFLEDLDDFRRFVKKAEEGDRAVEDARTAAGMLEFIFHLKTPQETRSGENGCLRYLRRMYASCFRVLRELNLWPGSPSEILTCEKCGKGVSGERGPKIHLQQWCGQKRSQMRKQHHVYKPGQRHREIRRSQEMVVLVLPKRILRSIKPHCS